MAGFDRTFTLMSTLVPIFFVIILGLILFSVFSGARRWHRNNQSPVLTVWARVVNLREDVSHHHHSGDTGMHSSSTWYYATFEVESGDRMELSVTGQEYGMLAIGDAGRLTFQGTRFQGFERETA